MKIAEFEERLAELISRAMKDENNEIIRKYAVYQLNKMDYYKTRGAYVKAMKLGDEDD